ncbi:MAG: tetratricopeptide repeat protein [Chloroflexi bacterium]|nr:tetratricopeptide repeat protein [Chloroflexota bacterium]
MEFGAKLQEARAGSQMRLARHYVDVVREANTVYLQGSASSVMALRAFDLERPQIEQWRAWLLGRAATDDQAAGLLVSMTLDGERILRLRLAPGELVVWHESALNAARRLGDTAAAAAHLRCIADAQVLLGNIEQGNAAFLEACALAEQLAHWQQLADALVTLAEHESSWGKLDEASQHSLRALEIYQHVGDRRGSGIGLRRLGWIAISAGEWQKAEGYLQEAHAIALQTGDLSEIGATLHNLGIVYNRTGKFDKGSESHLQALEFSRRIGDEQGTIAIMLGIAFAYRQQEKVPETQDVLLQALAVAKRTGRIRAQVNILANLGLIADDSKDYVDAVRYLEESLAISRAQGLWYDTCVNCGNLIFPVLGLGLFDKARTLLLEGLELSVTIAAVPLKTTLLASAVYLWMKASEVQTDESIQREMMETAAYWTGVVFACPGALQANRAGIAVFRPNMESLLGLERVDDLLNQGGQVEIDDVIADILATLRAASSA